LLSTGLRFVTVYGSRGLPGMALFLFALTIEGRSTDVFKHGKMQRDFTYIDDIVEGGALDQPVRVSEPFNGLAPDPACSICPTACSISAMISR
jgi:UDP-glucuronate 4-epimerase